MSRKAGTSKVPRKKGKPPSRSSARGTPGRSSALLDKIFQLVKDQPGIRPSEVNRILKLEQSDALRNALIKRGLIRKVKDGNAMRYYVV